MSSQIHVGVLALTVCISCESTAPKPAPKPVTQPGSTKVRVLLPNFALTLPHQGWKVERNAVINNGRLVTVAVLHGAHDAQITILVGNSKDSLKYMADQLRFKTRARGFVTTHVRTEVAADVTFSSFSITGETGSEHFGASVAFVRMRGLDGFVYSLNGVWLKDHNNVFIADFEAIVRSMKILPQ